MKRFFAFLLSVSLLLLTASALFACAPRGSASPFGDLSGQAFADELLLKADERLATLNSYTVCETVRITVPIDGVPTNSQRYSERRISGIHDGEYTERTDVIVTSRNTFTFVSHFTSGYQDGFYYSIMGEAEAPSSAIRSQMTREEFADYSKSGYGELGSNENYSTRNATREEDGGYTVTMSGASMAELSIAELLAGASVGLSKKKYTLTDVEVTVRISAELDPVSTCFKLIYTSPDGDDLPEVGIEKSYTDLGSTEVEKMNGVESFTLHRWLSRLGAANRYCNSLLTASGSAFNVKETVESKIENATMQSFNSYECELGNDEDGFCSTLIVKEDGIAYIRSYRDGAVTVVGEGEDGIYESDDLSERVLAKALIEGVSVSEFDVVEVKYTMRIGNPVYIFKLSDALSHEYAKTLVEDGTVDAASSRMELELVFSPEGRLISRAMIINIDARRNNDQIFLTSKITITYEQ